ncbi:hypothetical protein Pogu_2148 [Pyrobaculum oguniense TE7]|uniref:Uncharacterized protein n=1 Tax=Pyrobaculum oguniense (strain DSM 13380 / JCM 10595 / TE7) TaxID=698757 RepID=H6QCX6_PYROT|nr:hypothetical protein Pogu_2148 [Pyrobaculum oguniense TE7]
MQEAISLPLMVLIAALMVAVGGLVVWHFQDAQKVADWGEAYVYPLARPYNDTHFWLGAQAAFADVVVGRVAVDGAEYLVSARLQREKQAWLNYSGQPLLVRCNSTVAYEVRRGSASRVLAFKAVCPEREASLKTEKHGDWLLPMMVAYGSYVLDYVAFNETAVITAYFKGDGVYVRNIWDRPVTIAVDPPIGAAYGDLYSAASAARMFVLLPGQEAKIVSMNSLAPVDFNYVTYYPVGRRWVYGIPLVNGSAVELWLNVVPSYRGPASGAEVLSPIGVRAYVQPDGVRLPYWVNTGPPGNEGTICSDGLCYCKKNGGLYFNGECYVQGEHLMPLGASWSGWVEGYNIYFKTWRELFRTRYVFKADPIPYGQLDRAVTLYVYPGAVFNMTGSVVNATNLGNGTVALREAGSGSALVGYQLVGPLQVFEVGAVRRPDGLKVFWSEPANPLDVKEAVLKRPGGNVVNITAGAQGAALLYADDKFWIAVADFDILNPQRKNVRIAFGTSFEIRNIYHNNFGYPPVTGPGDVDCHIQTSGYQDGFDWPLDGKSHYWTLQCRRGGQPVATYRLEVNLGSRSCGLLCIQPPSYSIKVYVDGQLVREVSGRLYWDSKAYRWEMPIFPSYVPVYVWWNGSEVKMWGLPRGVGETVVGYIRPKQTNTGAYVRLPYLYKVTDIASYKYTLRVKAGYTAQQLGYDHITGNYLYKVQASSVLWLYLWDKLVGYDAVDGVGYTTAYVGSGSYSAPDEACVPTKIMKPKNHEHRNWKEVPGGYTVDIYITYEVREFGCGSDVTYTYKEYWTTVKAEGNIYVISDQGKTCTMQQRNIDTDKNTGKVGCVSSQN